MFPEMCYTVCVMFSFSSFHKRPNSMSEQWVKAFMNYIGSMHLLSEMNHPSKTFVACPISLTAPARLSALTAEKRSSR